MRFLLLAICLAHFSQTAPGEELFPEELVNFRPFPGNPVFTAAGEGHWDTAIRERGWILKDGDIFKMWYTGYDGSREGLKMLGYATSRDGIRWERHAENPLYREHWVEDMMVLRHEGRYLMFAEGAGDQAQLLTSPDGLQWRRIGSLDVRQTNGEPISPGPYGTPTVLFEDGLWYLFYERRDAGVWLATSKDLKIWRNAQDEPVLTKSLEGFDSQMIALNQVIKQDGRYFAYYHGSGSVEKPRLWACGVATSTDLVHWTKFPENPLTSPRADQSSGLVVQDGQRWRFYTMHGRVELHLPAVEP